VRPAWRRTLVRLAWTTAIALLAILFLKVFVVDVKHVESGSMEPTISGSPTGGESVLVLYGAFEPKRFDYVVVSREGEAVPIVKRVCGLPKESLQIVRGDLLIDGRRLPADAPRPAPIPFYDSRLPSAAGAFAPAAGKESLWTQHEGEWSLDAREVKPGTGEGLQEMRRPLTDGFLAPGGTLVRGENDVNDAVVECDVRFEEPRGRILFQLAEQGDRFLFSLDASATGRATARIARVCAASPEETLASKEVPLQAGAWTHVRCSNVDNHLAFEIAGADGPICAAYDENGFEEGDPLKEGKTFAPRVRFGGEGGLFGFRSLRVLRDLYYTGRGTHGVSQPADLGPDEYFVLGDNSASSRDSREWGPIHGARILGRPVWVVWPLSRIRRLPPAVPGPCGR
jgi:type IV secretory pathway protease TraF